jgi:hypothetical protein
MDPTKKRQEEINPGRVNNRCKGPEAGSIVDSSSFIFSPFQEKLRQKSFLKPEDITPNGGIIVYQDKVI